MSSFSNKGLSISNDSKDHRTLFNLYYANDAKAIKMAMLINDRILDSVSEKNEKSFSGSFGGKLGISSLIGVDGSASGTRALEITNTFKVSSEISVTLRPIYDSAISYNGNSKIRSGDIIKIEDIDLKVENYLYAFLAKALINKKVESFKNLEFNSKEEESKTTKKAIRIGPVAEIFLKNYTYVISSKDSEGNTLVMRIPIQSDKDRYEMEDQYDIKELEISRFTILGIYRGAISQDDYEGMKRFDEDVLKAIAEGDVKLIKERSDSTSASKSTVSDDRFGSWSPEVVRKPEIRYVDLIAILQGVNIRSDGRSSHI